MPAVALTPDDAPRWLWRLLRLGLAALVSGGAVLSLVLAGGVADPPRAARLTVDLPTGVGSPLPAVAMPALPVTVEVAGAFVAPVDPGAWWGVALTQDGRDVLRVSVDAQGFYRLLPEMPDTTTFIHLRRDSQSNEIYLHIEADGMATVRLNREVAWRGRVSATGVGMMMRVWTEQAVSGFDLRYFRLYVG